MVEVDPQDLSGYSLDYAIAKLLDYRLDHDFTCDSASYRGWHISTRSYPNNWSPLKGAKFHMSMKPQVYQKLEDLGISVQIRSPGFDWIAVGNMDMGVMHSYTASDRLTAELRALVGVCLGRKVLIPKDLLPWDDPIFKVEVQNEVL